MKRLLLIFSVLLWVPVAEGNLALAGTEKAASVCEELLHECVVPPVRQQQVVPARGRAIGPLPRATSFFFNGRTSAPTARLYLRHRCLLI
jgi:hypothetical protein